jgi:hypothetical protein
MIFRIILVIGFLICSSAAYSQPSQSANFYRVYELVDGKLGVGTYFTQGYVVQKYVCPACLEGNLCKPCLPNYILISENPSVDADSLLYPKMMVFVEDARIFEERQEYKFLVQILDVKSIDQKLNNMKLIYAAAIEAPAVENMEVPQSITTEISTTP